MTGITIIGIGNPYRRDDGVGIRLARRVAAEVSGVDVVTQPDDMTDFLDTWQGRKRVLAIDAIAAHPDAPRPGKLHRFFPLKDPLPPQPFGASSHSFGLREALELGKVLDNLPSELILLGVEGKDFGYGEALSPEVESSLEDATQRILKELEEMALHEIDSS